LLTKIIPWCYNWPRYPMTFRRRLPRTLFPAQGRFFLHSANINDCDVYHQTYTGINKDKVIVGIRLRPLSDAFRDESSLSVSNPCCPLVSHLKHTPYLHCLRHGQLWESRMSSTKPEVHNVLQRRQRKIELRHRKQVQKILYGKVLTCRSWDMFTDRQTDQDRYRPHTNTLITILSSLNSDSDLLAL